MISDGLREVVIHAHVVRVVKWEEEEEEEEERERERKREREALAQIST